ncbi:MAG: hypothetical protein ABI665_05185 [Vicinamibacterales bacterium]
MIKWIVRGVVTLLVGYVVLAGAVTLAMVQPPERFGQIMKRVPAPLVWGVLPGPRLWAWARRGALSVGDEAPDFNLSTYDHKQRVSLSSHRGQRPVVLVFGSYT